MNSDQPAVQSESLNAPTKSVAVVPANVGNAVPIKDSDAPAVNVNVGRADQSAEEIPVFAVEVKVLFPAIAANQAEAETVPISIGRVATVPAEPVRAICSSLTTGTPNP